MTGVELTVILKAGPVNIEFETDENSVLHNISVQDFVNKVLDLSNYVGPEDDPPYQPPKPVGVVTYNPNPDDDWSEQTVLGDGTTVTQGTLPGVERRKRVGSKDPMVEKFTQEEVPGV